MFPSVVPLSSLKQGGLTGLCFPGGSEVKASACNCGSPGFDPWVGNIPWIRKWQLIPVFLPGESHGWRSLVGYSPRGHKESGMTEQVNFRFNFPVFLPGKYHEWRNLEEYSPWGCKELDMTERLNFHFHRTFCF